MGEKKIVRHEAKYANKTYAIVENIKACVYQIREKIEYSYRKC